MLSRLLIDEIEGSWRSLAADLLTVGSASDLAEAETAARRQVEELVFQALCGEGDPDTALRRAIGAEDPSLDALEAVHQHLLSRQLHRTDGGQLQSQPSCHHRRSQGIYYTPDYVARYLAQRCLSGATDGSGLRIFDPACGCGRFLVASAEQLIEQGRPIDEIAESLHGCDLDGEAVVVARRMLGLTLGRRANDPAGAAAIRAALERNIFCADSLSETFWQSRSVAQREDRPSQEDTTAPVPCFDVILGNPPYRRERGAKILLEEIAKTELGRRYRAPRMDLWYYFLHRGIELLAPGGRLGFIIGAYWAAGTGAGRLIAALRETVHVEEIFQLDRLQVFPRVAGHHMMLIVSKRPPGSRTTVRLPVLGESTDARPFVEGSAKVHTFTKTPEELFRQGLLDLEPPAERLLGYFSQLPRLGELGKVRQGIAENPAAVTVAANRKHGNCWRKGEGVFALTAEELGRLELPLGERHLVHPYHDLRDLGRYDRAGDPSLHLIYSTRQTWAEAGDHPALLEHLARFRPIMEARRETRQGTRGWWQLHWPREAWIWDRAKIIALQMAARPSFVPAGAPTYVSFSANVFLPHPGVREHLNYFAALLNSRLLWKWFRHHAKRRGVGLEINGHVLARVPIRRIDFESAQDTDVHAQLVGLVERMLELSQARRRDGKAEIEVERQETDREIDNLVCRLYGLTSDDIAAVQAACEGA